MSDVDMMLLPLLAPLLAIVAIFALAGLTGWRIARHNINGGWHHRWLHTCGFHTRYRHEMNPCARCGMNDQAWRERTMRARFIGWESTDAE